MPIYKTTGKKDGLQKYFVRINFVGDDGKSKQLTRTAYGLEAAKDLERTLSGEIKSKNENHVKRLTVEQLYDLFITAKKFEIRESSLDKYERSYRLHIAPFMASVRIDKLTPVILEKWKLSVEKKGLSLKSKKHAYGDFRAMLNYAVNMEYISANPLLKVGNFKDSLFEKPVIEIYTPQEFSKFISAAKCLAIENETEHSNLSEWDYYVFFNIAFYTGLRKGEIHALKWSDINGSILSVKRSITQKLRGGDRETPPKNKTSLRSLQMPLPLISILNEHKKRQEYLDNFTDDYRICGAERCLRDTSIQNKAIRYATLAGLSTIRVHDFRHSHVSVLANEGINIQEIARRLGHARVEMTWNTYSHLYPREEEKAVNVLNNIA